MTNIDSILYKHPHSIKRLGETIFIKLPLYESQKLYEPIYINNQLFKTLFQKELAWEQQSDFIKHLFSVTLDCTLSNGEHCGWAFVDKQGEDPYEISLMGNKGSGRAFYTGTCFNIKGEKTPLATSKSPIHSNGVLSMEDGIWSALIGNALEEEFNEKPSPVLAILQMDHYRCLIVRIDESGSLDRITHLFYNPSPLNAKKLKQTAKSLGRLEAEKFTHRILHGSWSAGNTSLLGHLIDYDSVCAVKGRQAQYSFTPSYPDNYFGFEYLGQIKILKSLCDNLKLNVEGIQLDNLEKIFKKSFEKHILEGLSYLMGFEDFKELANKFQLILKKLTNSFYDLSHYTYYLSSQNLNTNRPASLFFHLFDFSAFFRVYPLLKFSKKFTYQLGLSILMESPGQQEMKYFEDKSEDEELMPRVSEHLAKYLIPFQQGCPKDLEKQALEFIKNYDHVFDLLLQATEHNTNQIATRAYIINEDRFYLFPVFSLELHILNSLEQNSSPKTLDRFMQNLIKANQRIPKLEMANGYISDFRMFVEGFSHVSINAQGSYQVVFHLYRDKINWEINEQDTWHIEVLSELMPSICLIDDEFIQIRTVDMPISELALHYYRENTLLVQPYILYRNLEKMKTHDLFFPDRDQGYYI
jgi:hypothetical protein